VASDHPPQRREALRVESIDQPGWEADSERMPGVGEDVLCVDGVAEVVRVLGKTSDGSRLLELRLLERPKPPYFASSSNVLQRAEHEDARVTIMGESAENAAPFRSIG
jgi:hypothetical protein